MDNSIHEEDSILLMQAENDIEASVVESLLAQYNIPILKKYNGNKAFLKVIMGTVQGIDIFVRLQDLEDAKVIIEDINLNNLYSE